MPDPHCTPGAITAAVSQANVRSTICHRGYTKSVRPPESVTEPEKRASVAAYGDIGPLRDYEYDHLIPLDLGGAPNDPRNLWPESGASPNPKDQLEERLRSMVCDGELSIEAAQQEIAGGLGQRGPAARLIRARRGRREGCTGGGTSAPRQTPKVVQTRDPAEGGRGCLGS